MEDKTSLDLDGLDVQRIEMLPSMSASVDSLDIGHGITEVGASCDPACYPSCWSCY